MSDQSRVFVRALPLFWATQMIVVLPAFPTVPSNHP